MVLMKPPKANRIPKQVPKSTTCKKNLLPTQQRKNQTSQNKKKTSTNKHLKKVKQEFVDNHHARLSHSPRVMRAQRKIKNKYQLLPQRKEPLDYAIFHLLSKQTGHLPDMSSGDFRTKPSHSTEDCFQLQKAVYIKRSFICLRHRWIWLVGFVFST